MSNAATVALRIARSCVPAPASQGSLGCISRSWHPHLFLARAEPLVASRPAFSDLKSTKISIQRRTFSRSTRCHFRQSFASQLLKPYGSGNKPEKGLKFRSNELSEEEIYFVFGRDPPPADFANRLLRILNGRRHDGTLDLALPEDVQEGLEEYPDAFEDGLRWLRETYPVDEDEAIMARIDREEHELERDNPSELMQRGQDLGIYKTTKDVYYGPQSGFYQAKLSDKEGDVYGVSELDKIRAENEARAAREEEELQAQIEERMAKAKTEQTKALAQRPEQSLESAQELRPPNRFEKWVMKARNRAESKLTLDSPEVAQQTTAGRLIPSFIFVTLVCGGCYILSQVWVRPKQSERLFPDVSLSFATIGSLIAINLAVFYAWRMPSFWAVLNKYFIIVPAYPYFLSMMGNLFSHQKFTHLFANMLPLVIFGLPLHEEIGRGNFLAIYLASGLIGGYASFARHAIQRVFVTSTLGASGCVYGVLTAYFALHLNSNFSIVFFPSEWAEKFSLSGQTILICVAASQIFGVFTPLKKVDYFNHLVGMAVGFCAARWLQATKKKEKPRSRAMEEWWSSIMGRKP